MMVALHEARPRRLDEAPYRGVSSGASVRATGRGGTNDNEVLADGRPAAVALVQHPRGRSGAARRLSQPADAAAAHAARPDADLPDGDHRAGGVDRTLDRDPRSGPRRSTRCGGRRRSIGHGVSRRRSIRRRGSTTSTRAPHRRVRTSPTPRSRRRTTTPRKGSSGSPPRRAPASGDPPWHSPGACSASR